MSPPGRGRGGVLFQGKGRGAIPKQPQQSQQGQAQPNLPSYFAPQISQQQIPPNKSPIGAWGNITAAEAVKGVPIRKTEPKVEPAPQQLHPQPGASQQQRPTVKSPNQKSMDIVTEKMKTLTAAKVPPKPVAIPSSAPMNICQNKGAGKSGKSVPGGIQTNYLALIIKDIIDNAYHYDITIEPNTPKRLLKFAFDEFRKVNIPNAFIAFDGQKSAYSTAILDLSKPIQREVTVTDHETEQQRRYVVTIKEVRDNVIDLRCLKT